RPGRARTGLPADPVALLQWSAGRPHLLKALPSRTATGRQAGRGPLEWGGRTAHLRFGSTGRDCPRTSGVVRRSLTSSGRALPSPDSPPFDEARVGHGVSQAPATTTPDERAEPAAAGARADPRLPRPRPRGGGARLPPPLLPAPGGGAGYRGVDADAVGGGLGAPACPRRSRGGRAPARGGCRQHPSGSQRP